MQAGGYLRRYRVKPRFYLIILVMLGLAVWGLLYLLGAFRQPRVEWGRLASDQPFTAIVLRDEQLINATEYSKLSCIAAEGEPIVKDSPVAMLYLSGFSEIDISHLAALRNEIKDYQENNILKATVNKGLQELNNQIDGKMSEISAMAIGRQTQNLAAAEQELRTFMQQRKDYMPTIANADDTLNRYYQEEESLRKKIDETRKVVNSPADGLVSYYLDGYEKILTVNGINDMTPDKVKSLTDDMLVKNTRFESSQTVQANNPICRIVNPSSWYAVIVMNARENPFIQGMQYDLTFGGLQSTVSGKAVRVAVKGRYALAVLKVDGHVKEMISLRLVSGHIGRDIEGFRVPVGMVREENGKATIAIQVSGKKRLLEVSLLGRDEKYAIIADKQGSSELMIGLPLVKP